MRIVSVANFYGPRSGGLRTTMHALGRGYLEAGHDSVLVVPGAEWARESTQYGLRITVPSRVVPGTGGYRVITDVRRLQGLLDDLGPDRLEVSDRTTLRGLGGWARARGIPSVVWAHERVDGVVTSALPWAADAGARTVADRLNRALAQSFDRVVTTTEFAAAEFLRVGAPNLVRVPLGVDLATFSPGRHDVGLRRQHVADDEVMLVLCSRLSPEKRPEIAVDALRVLLQKGTRARLVVAGTGPREPLLRERAAGLPVTLLGFVSDRTMVARLLATADVVIAPGPIETFGLAALEALASGTPVVASSTSALPEVIGDRAGATAAPHGAAMALAVRAVLDRPEHERRSAARARAEQFPWSSTVSRMLALHETTGTAAEPAREATSALPRARTAALVRASYARTLMGSASQTSGGAGPRVCALGDSVTLGVGDLVEPGQRPGWAAHVATALDASVFANLSSLGARACTVVDEQLERALEHAPDLVLVSAGGNDVLRGDLDARTVVEATQRYVDALRSVGAAVVLSRLPDGDHVSWLPRRLRLVLQHRVAVVNLALETVSERARVPLVSVAGPATTAGALWHVDRIHPGPLGHRRLAQSAVGTLADRGFAAVNEVPPITAAPPGAASQVGWLVRNGAPWIAKRSVDLAPALGRQLLSA